MKYYDVFSRHVKNLIKPIWRQLKEISEEEFSQFKSSLKQEITRVFNDTTCLEDICKEEGLDHNEYKLDIVEPDKLVFQAIAEAARDIVASNLREHLKDVANKTVKNEARQVYQAYENAHWEWQMEMRRLEDDPDSADWDYEGIVYPEAPHEPYVPDMQTFISEEFGDLDDLDNLIQICRGEENLDWLLCDVVENTLDSTDTLVRNFDYSQCNLPKAIVSHFIYQLDSRFIDLNISQDNFILNAYLEQVDSIDFSRFKSISASGELTDIIDQVMDTFIERPVLKAIYDGFIKSYQDRDLLTMQRLWLQATAPLQILFCNLGNDKLLPATRKELKKASTQQKKIVKKIEKRLATRQENQGLIYKILPIPTADTRLVFRAKDLLDRKRKSAFFNVFPCLEACRQRGAEAKAIFLQARQALDPTFADHKPTGTNMIVPVMYFVVSTKPHKKGGDHKRIFITVDLNFSDLPVLIARDSSDKVVEYKAKNPHNLSAQDLCYEIELADDSAFKKLIPDYPGKMIDELTSLEISSHINHSERLLYRVLRKADYVAKVVSKLQKALGSSVGTETFESPGQFKVYAFGLLLYSINATCEHCARPTILSQQNIAEGVFAAFLARLNSQHSRFKAKATIKFNTIVLADKPFGEIKDITQTGIDHTVLRLETYREIDIKNTPPGSFFEFIAPDEKLTGLERPITSNIFISAFKGKFFKSDQAISSANERFEKELRVTYSP